jgi:predicted small secreted protein
MWMRGGKMKKIVSGLLVICFLLAAAGIGSAED